jgi:hypothetical protein
MSDDELTPKDYALLEAQRREDIKFGLKLGTIEGLEMTLKLFRAGLIKRLDREATLDEKEKIQKFLDSSAYKQRIKRLQKLATKEDMNRIDELLNEIGMKSEFDLSDLTDKGKKVLEEKREEVEQEWKELELCYEQEDKTKFREKVNQWGNHLFLFLIMGFANGAMMGHMMNKMDTNYEMYMQGMEEMYDTGYTDAGGVIEGGDIADAGGDIADAGGEGGFMDGGANVGF